MVLNACISHKTLVDQFYYNEYKKKHLKGEIRGKKGNSKNAKFLNDKYYSTPAGVIDDLCILLQ
jgi:hypothetical protein